MKRGSADNPKVDDLMRELSIGRAQAVGHLELLWHFTARFAQHGGVGKFSNQVIASKCCWDGDPDQFVDALVVCRWLDSSQTHRLTVHDWYEHCEDSVHVTLAREIQLFADGRVPKMSRLTASEREILQSEFASRHQNAPKRSETLTSTHERFETLKNALPCQAKPCLAKPTNQPTTGATARPEPKPEREPEPVGGLAGGLVGISPEREKLAEELRKTPWLIAPARATRIALDFEPTAVRATMADIQRDTKIRRPASVLIARIDSGALRELSEADAKRTRAREAAQAKADQEREETRRRDAEYAEQAKAHKARRDRLRERYRAETGKEPKGVEWLAWYQRQPADTG